MATLQAKTKDDSTGWASRHNSALVFPNKTERPMLHLLQAWEEYATEHNRHYSAQIGEDGVLGEAWKEIGTNLLTLLNGEMGRLDGGTLDAFIRDTLRENGIETETL